MATGPTRRALLRVAGAGLAAGLSGCSSPLDGGRSSGSPTATSTPAPLPTVDTDAIRLPPIGAVTRSGPLELLVAAVVRSERVTVLGMEIRRIDDDEFLAVETLLRNTSDRYIAVAVDRYEVVHETGVAESIEPIGGPPSSNAKGMAFAPGERRRLGLHYRVPPGATDVRLRGVVRIRSLPDEAVAVATLEVDLTTTAADPGRLDGSISAPIHGVGDRADASGLVVTVRDVTVPVEVPNWTPPSGFEHLALALSVVNGVEPGRPFVVDLGRFGGMALADSGGTEFTEDRWFDGTLAGGRRYDDATAVLPGETREGTLAVVVPADVTPLYLFWTPPTILWRAGTGVAVNRFVWRLRRPPLTGRSASGTGGRGRRWRRASPGRGRRPRSSTPR